MIEQLIEMLKTNEFAQGALIAAPATALSYAARNVPVSIWNSIKHFVSYDLVFRSDQKEYYHVNKLIRETVVKERWSRDFTYDVIQEYQPDGVNLDKKSLGLSIGYGRHWGRYKGTPVIIYRQLEEDNQSYNFKEMLYITFIGMNNNKAKEFADEVSEMMARRDGEDTVKLRVNCGTGWTQSGELPKRSLDTVFTSGETKNNLVKFLTDFQDSETEMLRKGLPWHSGILLTGKPGGGKTSLIHALASDMGRSVCFLNLSSLKSDSDLMQLIGGRNNWKNSFLVIEDIDAARVSVERDEKDSEQVSLNTLLNALDGFLTPHGLVVIATTNHPERLDPALIRSGRFDFVAELEPLELAEANKMAELLIGQSDFFGADYVPLMGADVREKLLKHKNIV